MAKKKKVVPKVLGASDDTVNVYFVNDMKKEVEVPLIYNVEYTYINNPEIVMDISTAISEKVGTVNTPDYLEYIFEDSQNMTRIDGEGKYTLLEGEIKYPTSEFANRPLLITHWTGVFPFIEYFQYDMPDDLFKITLDADQHIQVGGVKEMTYRPALLYKVNN